MVAYSLQTQMQILHFHLDFHEWTRHLGRGAGISGERKGKKSREEERGSRGRSITEQGDSSSVPTYLVLYRLNSTGNNTSIAGTTGLELAVGA